LTDRENFHYHKSPSDFFSGVRTEIDQHASPIERYCFFRVATAHDSKIISEVLTRKSVVSDRYILSTAAYHFVMDERIRLIHNTEGLVLPDISIVLTARKEIRDRRIRQRVQKITTLEQDSSFLDAVLEEFLTFSNIHVVDTSDINEEEVVNLIQEIIKNFKKC
jgi:thymidylate kinase